MFTLADSEAEGNLSFREREGCTHNGNAANEYMYNALRFFWNGGPSVIPAKRRRPAVSKGARAPADAAGLSKLHPRPTI